MVRDGVVDSSLSIYNVMLNDAGKYNCTATTHDRKTSAASIDIQVYSTHSYNAALSMCFLYQETCFQ